jgi:5,10-methylene-tetrahydrofolate dehydrogenase/methenyl tetrahydrofolate cyclohydrolase
MFIRDILYDTPFLRKNLQFLLDNKIRPSLAVVETSDDPGAKSYLKGIRRVCREYEIEYFGFRAKSINELKKIITEINLRDEILAALILYPTPFDIHDREFMNMVSAEKDVEGLHFTNLGYLVQFKKFIDPSGLRKLVIPPTSKGILYVLKRYFMLFEQYKKVKGVYPFDHDENPFELLGKKATIINDSLSVGKSLALMLMNENASVRVCQKYTDIQDIYQFTGLSDIIISAVPVSGWKIPSEYVADNAILFDVAFEGNFEYPDIYDNCFCIAPRWDETQKGNRINDMTLTRLISNTLYLANKKLPDNVIRMIYTAQKEVLDLALDNHLNAI